MTASQFVISLKKLHHNGKFIAREDAFNNCIFKVVYKNFNGLPAYFIEFEDENKVDICANNIVDIVLALREVGFDVVVTPHD